MPFYSKVFDKIFRRSSVYNSKVFMQLVEEKTQVKRKLESLKKESKELYKKKQSIKEKQRKLLEHKAPQ